MMPKEECPDIALLHQVLEGGLTAELEQLVGAHLEQCAVCRKRLEQAAVSDQTLNAVARNLRGTVELTDSVKNVIEKCSSDPQMMVSQSGRTPGTHERQANFQNDTIRTRQMHRHPRGMSPVTRGKQEMVAIGDRLGPYEILEEIGRGGVGVVWKAYDRSRQRLVALKVLDRRVMVDSVCRQRFLREATAVRFVDHQNVVTMYGVEESPVPYLVMEFVDGPSLRSYLVQQGTLDQTAVLRIGLQIANGLAALHGQGVTHRDVKPANIVLDLPTGQAKLTDFGLARTEGDSRLTMDGFVAGTPAFMSPEQAAGEQVDFRSDLFSLGSVLYVMATGRSPFDDDRTLAALERVNKTEPPSPQSINPDVPSSLSDLIQRLHSKQPGNRPDSAAEVAGLLQQQLDQRTGPRSFSEMADQTPIAVARVSSLADQPSSPLPFPPSAAADSKRSRHWWHSVIERSSRRRVIVAGGVIAGVIIALGLLIRLYSAS
jgi:serine/threonine protein kinase